MTRHRRHREAAAAKPGCMLRLTMRLIVIVAAATYIACMIYMYRERITHTHAYLGAKDLDPPRLILMWGAFYGVLPSLWLPIALTRPSQIILWIFYLIAFVPMSFAPILALPHPTEWLPIIAALTVLFGVLCAISALPRVRMPEVPFNGWATIVLMATFSYLYVAYVFNFRFRLVSFTDVYVVRLAFREASMQAGRFPSYLVFWIFNVFNPLFVVYGLSRRRYWLFGAGVAGQMLMFSLTAFKTVFISWVLILVLFVVMQISRRAFGLLLAVGAALLMIPAFLSSFYGAVLVYRTQIIGIITGWYFEFFSTHPKALWGDTALAFLSDYPYDRSIPVLIGTHYLNNPDDSVNANVFADSFAHFGWTGVIFATLLWALVLWFYDSVSIDHDLRVASLLIAVSAMAFTNAGLQTTLVTQGFLLLLLVVYLLPRQGRPLTLCPRSRVRARLRAAIRARAAAEAAHST